MDICTRAGLSLSTVSEQRSGDRLTPKTIIAIARAYRLNPVQELAQFAGYEALAHNTLSLVDAVPLYSALDLLHQRFVREGKALSGSIFTTPEARLKRWLEMNRQGATQKELAAALDMKPSNFSRQITDGTLPIYRILELAASLGISALPALVAAGHLCFEEVFGESPREYLSSRSDEELLRGLECAYLFLSADTMRFVSS